MSNIFKMHDIKNLTKRIYKPADLIKILGVSRSTVQKMTLDGRLKSDISPSGRRIVTREYLIDYLREMKLLNEESEKRIDIVYVRVFNSEEKKSGELDRQLKKVEKFANQNFPHNLEIIVDIGSGMDENRSGFQRLNMMVQNNMVDRIFVAHKDRLSLNCYKLFQQVCGTHQTRIIEVDSQIDHKRPSKYALNENEAVLDALSLIKSHSNEFEDFLEILSNKVGALS